MIEEFKPQLCDRLLEWRDWHEYTQAKAAEQLGVPLATYRSWETGRRKPQGLALKSVVEFLKENSPMCPTNYEPEIC